jgi:hypothetical protein
MVLDPASATDPGSLAALGWDADWAEAFAPFAGGGLRPRASWRSIERPPSCATAGAT